MTEIAFNQIKKASFEKVLVTLLQKSFDTGKRVLVLVDSEERLKTLDRLLLSYYPSSWLPHGTTDDQNPDEQPILLMNRDLNLNNAELLFLLYEATSSNIGSFERCFKLFEGYSETAVQAARKHWEYYKKAGHQVTYWQQNEDGSWAKKY